MPLFTCSQCENIDNTATSDYFIQVYVKKQKPLCFRCLYNKWHNHFQERKVTTEELLKGNIIYFEHSKHAKETKNKMIDFITNDNSSCIPRDKFEKMNINEILVIYRQLKGK